MDNKKSSGIGKPSFVHVLIVIFLEFFAWGLLTDQVITVSKEQNIKKFHIKQNHLLN
jgi:hypothetical protein